MHPKSKKNQFLYYRSQNWSLVRISEKIGVCRSKKLFPQLRPKAQGLSNSAADEKMALDDQSGAKQPISAENDSSEPENVLE